MTQPVQRKTLRLKAIVKLTQENGLRTEFEFPPKAGLDAVIVDLIRSIPDDDKVSLERIKKALDMKQAAATPSQPS